VLEARGSRNAFYHLEQAAEKVTRAVLTSEGQHGGTGHQLHMMIAQIPDENPLKAGLRAVEHLSAYATTYRYPTSVGRVIAPPPPEAFTRDVKAVGNALEDAALT
jgi:HEPN domain-containing protein